MAASSSGMGLRSTQPQVFINFRGEELRRGFVGFLKPALKNAFVNVFIDELELRGRDLKNLFVRIEESKIALVIFSKDYANSQWCLDELAKIKECVDLGNLDAIPVFYKIEPSVVKHLRGYFGKSFMNMKRRYKHDPERTQKWEEALVSVAQKFGLAFPEYSDRTEREFIKSIVVEVKRVLDNIREAAIEVAQAEASGLNNPNRTAIVAQEWYNPHQGQENQEEAIQSWSWGFEVGKQLTMAYTDYPKTMKRNGEGYIQPLTVDDEVIAQILQEELSRVALAEASGLNNPSRTAIGSQEWSNPNQGQENQEEAIQSWSLDSEVGKPLNQLIPVAHVPKINGELPSEDEQISDHEMIFQREILHNRLQLYGLVEIKIQRDGNCQFRSLSDQLYSSQDHHKFVRKQVVNQLARNREMYEASVPMAYTDYLYTMKRNGEWGDLVTLQAASDRFGFRIFVITPFKDTVYFEILPHLQKSKGVIFLSFWGEVNYSSINIKRELPIPEGKKKIKNWVF